MVTASVARCVGAALVAGSAALTVGACSGGTAHVTDGPQSSETATAPTKSAGGKVDLTVPASFDPAKLGPGWRKASAGAVPSGLYEPCGQAVSPRSADAKTFWFQAPSGYSVAVENAKLTVDASARRQALSDALLGCGADEQGGAVITNALLPRIGSLDSVGAHVSIDRDAGTGEQHTLWAAAQGNLLVSVLVTPPPASDAPGAVVDAFGARVAQAAVKAALGQAYGPVAAPGKDDVAVPGGAPAGGSTPQPVPSSDSNPDVTGPIQLPDVNEAPQGMDGPAPVEGYRKPDPNEP